ncbi:MAG: L-seryl-tRNA(Sec) selenium transferase [Clostridiales bacterium]|jgi:L-seryl-tRNA(Ser) seleniumtransferase|nr:L-seryl-tRNA(Sec) selenium transferase [Clostridiales bacterium]
MNNNDLYSCLPAIGSLLQDRRLADLEEGMRLRLCRRAVDAFRCQIEGGSCAFVSKEDFAEAIIRQVLAQSQPDLVPAINATGVILHTNLGRAPLAPAALAALSQLGSYTNLEYDLTAGRRQGREEHLEALLQALTGAEAALVVNNNAAALLLISRTLALGLDCLIARGELLEIGASCRIGDIIASGGADLQEVGSANCVYLKDYQESLTPRTALIFRIHRSNFQLRGFTHQPSIPELAAFAKDKNLVLACDLGSGSLLPDWEEESDPARLLDLGVDLLCFSGDKLLGGPQAGIILGRKHLIKRLRQNPLYRALRIDKMTTAALAATLACWGRPEEREAIPILGMLRKSETELLAAAQELAEALAKIPGLQASIEWETDQIGGGALPGWASDSPQIALTASIAAEELRERLRRGSPPVIARIKRERLYLSPRTLLPGQAEQMICAIKEAIK